VHECQNRLVSGLSTVTSKKNRSAVAVALIVGGLGRRHIGRAAQERSELLDSTDVLARALEILHRTGAEPHRFLPAQAYRRATLRLAGEAELLPKICSFRGSCL
jgi:hypothetical protein